MKKSIISIATCFLFINCYSQTDNSKTEITLQVQSDIDNFLVNGESIVDVMDKIVQSPRQQELTMKFQQGVQNNYEWFVEYMENATPGKPIKYHPNLGISEGEYNELQKLIKNIEIASSGRENVEIIKTDTTISFNSLGRLQILNQVKINSIKNEINIGEIKLSYSGSANVDNDENAFKSRWTGHNWVYEFPNGLDSEMLKDVQNLVAKNYKFTIGKLEKNDRTFIQIKGLEFDKGVKEVQFDIPLLFLN
ncbi:hypothetical protein [Flagellimonas pacifica]|uniref:Uncharacterized protein n=1 Tax=Flagellimonas pacifica TaxID=1247520 RepID=A0A285MVM3_9FLAO|nr:hypothetical protein [Allomuricauda parva]SNZ01234.1 hypothetical protein SAMN06265377_3071 [Allomuricauda parva]